MWSDFKSLLHFFCKKVIRLSKKFQIFTLYDIIKSMIFNNINSLEILYGSLHYNIPSFISDMFGVQFIFFNYRFCRLYRV